MNNNRLVSQKVQNFAIVATRPGSFQIPEISIPWWNTVTNKFQQATIPAQTIEVFGEAVNNQVAATSALQPNPENQTVPSTIVVKETSSLQWVFLALWLLTSLGWLMTYLHHKPKSKTNTQPKQSSVGNSLIQACKQNQGEQVLQQIVPWANSLNNNLKIHNLSDIKNQLNDDELSSAISELEQCCFGKSTRKMARKSFTINYQTIRKKRG